MAAAFLSDPEVGRALARRRAARRCSATPSPARDSLRGQLMRSDSARFLDRMFCTDKSFADCRRPWQVQAAASAFGWNAGCADARSDCGKRDLLFGRAARHRARPRRDRPLTTPVAYGRLMSEPLAGKAGAAMHLMKPLALDAGIVAPLRRRRRRPPPAATTTGRSAAAARSSTSSPKAGARAMRAPARSASPA